MPKVSVIVPVYNTEKYLKKCLDSLVNQTLEDIEIIVINDGTQDNSQLIIDEYVKLFPTKIKAYIKPNGGLSDARNYGLGKATGEYIGFADSDDYVDKTMFEKLYNSGQHNDADIVECDFTWCYEQKNRVDTRNYESRLELMLGIRVIVCNKIFKRDIIAENDLYFHKGVRYEDILFTYSVLPYMKNVSFVDEPLYYYIQRSDSLSNDQTEKVKDIFIILEELLRFYKERDFYESNKEVIEYLFIRLLLGSSFLRIIKIEDKKLRNKVLKENWAFLNKCYPDWKKNKYLNELSGMKNMYYRHTNRFTYCIFATLFGFKKG